MQIHKRLILSITLLLVGCVGAGPRFESVLQPQAEHAKVYIYRQPKMFQQGSFVGVRVDGELVATLKNGTYCALDFDDKSHEIEFSVDGNPICLTCKGKGPTILKTKAGNHTVGSTVFYKLDIFAPTSSYVGNTFLYSVAADLIPTQQDLALKELKELSLAINP
jgi:hypothetical protein